MKALGILLMMGAGGYLVYYLWKKQNNPATDSGTGGISIGQIGSSLGNGLDPAEVAAAKNYVDSATKSKQGKGAAGDVGSSKTPVDTTSDAYLSTLANTDYSKLNPQQKDAADTWVASGRVKSGMQSGGANNPANWSSHKRN